MSDSGWILEYLDACFIFHRVIVIPNKYRLYLYEDEWDIIDSAIGI